MIITLKHEPKPKADFHISHVTKVTRGIIKNLIGFELDGKAINIYSHGASKSTKPAIRREAIEFCNKNGIKIILSGKTGGFKANKPATLYFIKIGENTLGYGISNNFKTRLTQHKRTFVDGGVEFEVLNTFEFKRGYECQEAEALLKNNLPHNGCTLKGFKTEATALSYFNEAKRLVESVSTL